MAITFRRVNRRGHPNYAPLCQRHHLLPVALLARKQFRQFFADLVPAGFHFDDFATNGVLLPKIEAEALRLRLPLHRGPHPRYNALILWRVERIRADYVRSPSGLIDRIVTVQRLRLLQNTIRRSLMAAAVLFPVTLHRRDPMRSVADFGTIDEMIERVWT